MVDDSLSLSLQTWLPIKQTEAKRLEGQEKVFRVADMLQEKAYSSLVSVHGLHSTELEKVDQDQESPPWKKMYRWEFWGPVMTPEVANSEAPGCQKQNENVGEWGVISIGSAGKRQPPPQPIYCSIFVRLWNLHFPDLMFVHQQYFFSKGILETWNFYVMLLYFWKAASHVAQASQTSGWAGLPSLCG